MTKPGPNYHDNPRTEAEDIPTEITTLTEADRRAARRGADLVRLATGEEEKHSIETKAPFITPESRRLSALIDSSDISNPVIKNRLVSMIDFAANKEAITTDEATGLRHYLENADGFSDEIGRPKDIHEIRANS